MQVHRNYSRNIDLSTEKTFAPSQETLSFYRATCKISDSFTSLKLCLSGAKGQAKANNIFAVLKQFAADSIDEKFLYKGKGFTPQEAYAAASMYMYNMTASTLEILKGAQSPEVAFFDQLDQETMNQSLLRDPKTGALDIYKIAHRIRKYWVQQLANLANLEIKKVDREVKALIKSNEGLVIQKHHEKTGILTTVNYFNCLNYAFHKLDLPEAKFLNDNRNVKTQEYQTALNPLEKMISEFNLIPTAEPKAGDLVVYLDEDKQSIHYGVILEDGLVESRWADLSVVKHKLEECPFGHSYIFMTQKANVNDSDAQPEIKSGDLSVYLEDVRKLTHKGIESQIEYVESKWGYTPVFK